MRRTTIIATLGPASSGDEVLEQLIREGVDIFRLNFSHGDHEGHRKVVEKIRAGEKKYGRHVGILMDLQGPKIRVGRMPSEGVTLEAGNSVSIITRDIEGDSKTIPTTYEALVDDVNVGDLVLLNDGWIELKVTGKGSGKIDCQVEAGGWLGSYKGINLPGVPVSAPSLTEKDIEDLEFGLGLDVDFVAMSFVRGAEDMKKLKNRIRDRDRDVHVVAKIERPEAVRDIDAILEETDIVMIARGDLGVEMPPEKVPEIQKSIIEKANLRGRGVITATQMLESMISSPRPTRAEASDVANAVYDGTGSVMLSGETAVGSYPVQTVKMMSRIVEEAETRLTARPMMEPSAYLKNAAGFSGAVAHSAARAARELGAKAIVTFTQSGTTASLVSKYRPACPIIGATMRLEVARRMSLYWGVVSVLFDRVSSAESLVGDVDDKLLETDLVKKGDIIVITSGVPVGIEGTTNFMKIHRMGESD